MKLRTSLVRRLLLLPERLYSRNYFNVWILFRKFNVEKFGLSIECLWHLTGKDTDSKYTNFEFGKFRRLIRGPDFSFPNSVACSSSTNVETVNAVSHSALNFIHRTLYLCLCCPIIPGYICSLISNNK